MNRGFVGLLLPLVVVVMTGCGGSETTGVVATSPSKLATIAVGTLPVAVAVEKGSVWVVNFDDDTVSRIDPTSNQAEGPEIRVGNGPIGIAAVAGTLWVASIYDGIVNRIDSASGRTMGVPTRVGDRPLALAAGEGSVWPITRRPEPCPRSTRRRGRSCRRPLVSSREAPATRTTRA